MRWVRHMALHAGILTVTRDAQFTSQACPRCGHLLGDFSVEMFLLLTKVDPVVKTVF